MSFRNASLLCCWLALSNNKQSYKLQNKLKMAKLCLCVQRHTFLIYKEFNLIKIQTLYDAFVKQSISHFRQKNTNWIHNLCIAIWKLAFFRKCIESIGKFKKYRIQEFEPCNYWQKYVMENLIFILDTEDILHTWKQFSSLTLKESWHTKTLYHLWGHLDINLVQQFRMEFSIRQKCLNE